MKPLRCLDPSPNILAIGMIVVLSLFAAPVSVAAQGTAPQRTPSPNSSITAVRRLERLELVPNNEYRVAIQSTSRIFVMYFCSTFDGFDFEGNRKNRYSWNEHAIMFMEWLIGVYGNSIDRYIFVDVPYSREGIEILARETGRDKEGDPRFPSFAYYVSGTRKLVIRGPASDSDIENQYERFAKFFAARGLRPPSADPVK
jgi:hypothetical protein